MKLVHSLGWACVLLLAGATRADVLIGNGPGSPYMGVQHAVGVAHVGDVVLLRVNVTENLTISKGIALVADVPGRLTWQGWLHVQDIPAGETLLVNGFNFGLVSSTPVVISQNAGSIRFQDCGVLPVPVPMQPAQVGVVCTTNSDVAFLRCGLRGGQGPGSPFPPSNGARAMTLTDSVVTIHDSDVSGGPGMSSSSSTPSAGTNGGPAIVMSGGQLVLQSALVHGGAGGAGFNGSCTGFHATAGGNGGTGLVLTNGAVARAVGGRTLGGVGGTGGVNPCEQAANGARGAEVDASGGTWTRVEGVGRWFSAPRIVRVGEPLSMLAFGAPGETAFLAGGPAAGYLDSPVFDGVLLVQPQFRRVDYGFVDGAGTLPIALTTAALPPGVNNDMIHLQPVMVDLGGQAHVGCAQIVVRVAAGN